VIAPGIASRAKQRHHAVWAPAFAGATNARLATITLPTLYPVSAASQAAAYGGFN